jgi:thiol-disulfide isomerase/thioredoxin
MAKAKEEWAKEAVAINMIDEPGVKDLLQNKSDKLRLINLWATWCGPCVTEFPSFIEMNRMYRNRDFELVTISADNPTNKDKVLKFLTKNQASASNYLFSLDDKYKLIEAVDPKWQGALPYTVLVEPGGKIIYAKQGIIKPAAMKKLIIEHPLMGRVY